MLSLGTATLTHAQFFDKLKTKTKTAANNSVDRSTDKTVDKAVTQPADKATDKILNSASDKLNGLFKKRKKNKSATPPSAPTVTDSTATKPETQN